ncbi:MAG: hypothetical protein WAK39_21465, partial [Pseudolabrys sp.]
QCLPQRNQAKPNSRSRVLQSPAGKNDSRLAPDTQGGLGAVTGFLSFISGTGGPLICLPLLL